MRARNLDSETRGMDINSAAYKAIEARYKQEELKKEQHYQLKYRMVKKLMALLAPVRSISVSKLQSLDNEKLIRIGKAARALYGELEAAGLISRDFMRENNRDF